MTKKDYSQIKQRTIKLKTENDDVRKSKTAVAKGIVKKESLPSKIGKLFFGEEGAKGIFKGIITTIIVPTVQNTIADVSTAAINRAIYGENIPASKLRRGGRSGRTRYEDEYDRNRRRSVERTISDFHDSRPSWSLKEVEYETESDAREVFNKLLDSIDEYDYVTVGDYYEYSQVASRFTDHQYGWSDLSKASLVITRDNTYVLDLPKPRLID